MSLLTSLANTAIASGAASRNGAILSANVPVVEEGDEVHFTLYVPGGVEGTTYPYTITGISQSDLFYGTLTGNFTLNSVESANVPIILARDDVVEVETITMTVDSLNVSVQVTIDDTTSVVGEAVYEIPGTYSWTCPAGVTSVSTVAIGGGGGGRTWFGGTQGGTGGGGGGLGYKNNIAVTPGENYTVVVGWGGTSAGSGGDSYFISSATVAGGRGIRGNNQTGSADVTGGAGGTYTGDGGGNGGTGIVMDRTYSNGKAGGGSGAGGYGLEGGYGGGSTSTVSDFSKRNGGGGTYSGAGGGMLVGSASITGRAGAGGGTGLYGREPGYISTSGGTYRATSGAAGDGQQYGPQLWVSERDGDNQTIVSNKQKYGGGGPARNDHGTAAGSSGAVRIMWGPGRSFPSNAEYREYDGNPTATLEYTLNVQLASGGELFGYGVALSGKYAAVGSPGGDADEAHIFDVTNGQLLYTLTGHNKFGTSVCIEGKYLAVGSPEEPHPVNERQLSGAVHVYDVTTGELLHTMTRPDSPTATNDLYGTVPPRISGVHMIVGAERIPSPSAGGRVYIYELVNGSLLHTIDNPNIDTTDTSDYFGQSVDISGNYAIVGARLEDRYEGGSVSASGNAYIINVTTGTVIKVLDNPNAPGTSAGADQFGYSVAISGNYAIVSAYTEDVGGTSSGSVYIFKTTSGDWSDATVIHSIDNPTTGTATSDLFGYSVDISGNYAIVGAYGSESGTDANSGKVYIFDVVNGTLVSDITNPTPFVNDYFGGSVSISGNYALVGAYGDHGFATAYTGRSYIYKLT